MYLRFHLQLSKLFDLTPHFCRHHGKGQNENIVVRSTTESSMSSPQFIDVTLHELISYLHRYCRRGVK